MGDPRLLERARPVGEFDTPELHALLADMQDTMRALNGAGLAAPHPRQRNGTAAAAS